MAEAVPQGPIAALLGWLCSGGTQMAAMASSLLTAILYRVLWLWQAGPAPPWLLLPSFRLCFSQLSYQGRWLPAEPQANGQMGSPQLRTKSKTLLTLPVFLAGISQKNFFVASVPASTWNKSDPMQILDFLICLQMQHQVGSLHSKRSLNYP